MVGSVCRSPASCQGQDCLHFAKAHSATAPQAAVGSGRTPLREIEPGWTSCLPSAEGNGKYREQHLERLRFCGSQARAQSHGPGAGVHMTGAGDHQAGMDSLVLSIRLARALGWSRRPGPAHAPAFSTCQSDRAAPGFSSATRRPYVPPDLAAAQEGRGAILCWDFLLPLGPSGPGDP